jgi:hypothetical protein
MSIPEAAVRDTRCADLPWLPPMARLTGAGARRRLPRRSRTVNSPTRYPLADCDTNVWIRMCDAEPAASLYWKPVCIEDRTHGQRRVCESARRRLVRWW